MRVVLDTNVIRRLATGKLGKPQGFEEVAFEVAPGTIVELLTELNEGNLEVKLAAARYILENQITPLPLPPVYLMRELDLIDGTRVDAQENFFKIVLQDFVRGKRCDFRMPSGMTFEEFRTQYAGDYANGLSERRDRLFQKVEPDSAELKKLRSEAVGRVALKWGLILNTIKNISKVFPDLVHEGRISLETINNLVVILEVYFDVVNYTSMMEISRMGKVDPNDSIDLSLFYYLGPSTLLATGDRRWIRYAVESGHGDKVIDI